MTDHKKAFCVCIAITWKRKACIYPRPSLLHEVPCPRNVKKLEYCLPDISLRICYPKLQELKMLLKKNNVRNNFSELISQCRKHISYRDTY